jgi:predicted site-specific integrase-resolvase
MPVVINNQTYYRTAEVCRIVGISRNTLFRWLKEGVFSDVEYRDWRDWRPLEQRPTTLSRQIGEVREVYR